MEKKALKLKKKGDNAICPHCGNEIDELSAWELVWQNGTCDLYGQNLEYNHEQDMLKDPKTEYRCRNCGERVKPLTK